MNRIYGAVCELSQSQHMACSYLQERGMIKLPASSLPPTNSPQFMNSPVLPEIDSSQPRFRRPAIKLPANLIPTKTSWIRALCLLPLVLPGMRVVSSGLSWFNWLNFPMGWLLAAVMFMTMHVAIPFLILAGLYQLVISRWQRSSRSISRTTWFAFSTIAIILLSFAGTATITNVFEGSICQIVQSFSAANVCMGRFAPTGIQDLAANIDAYNFQLYTWALWITITAYLYQLENSFQERYAVQAKNVRGNYRAHEAVTHTINVSFDGEDTFNQEYDETA
jgi:hypothetical protein